ncbi:MAG TPA: PDZ domain-containing protein, partial [Ferruginibacter sp.]|nr:PDZ domain-containing protein [Ferruginibacter sp.]
MTGFNHKFLSIPVLVMVLLSACKKDRPDVAAVPPTTVSPPPPVTASPDLVKDTALMASRELYLWNTQIPATFNARDYADPAAIMKAIQPFSMEPGFGTPVDKWSFAMKKTEWDQMSGGIGSLVSGTGDEGDFGMFVFFRAEGDLRVRLVEPNSPAGMAGIKRGWRITQINGNSNITTAGSSSIVNSVYYSATTSFVFARPDGSSVSFTLNATHYAEKPVMMDTVYNMGTQRIGYLVFNSFLGN